VIFFGVAKHGLPTVAKYRYAAPRVATLGKESKGKDDLLRYGLVTLGGPRWGRVCQGKDELFSALFGLARAVPGRVGLGYARDLIGGDR
jgi:hypothetical protein